MAQKKAGEEKARAEANAKRARERAYGSDLRLAQHAWEDNLIGLFYDLLEGQRPARTDDVELRGFEWHYGRRVAKAFGIFGHHGSAVRSVCFSPNGKRLASAGTDGTVKVWDAETGQEKLIFTGHTSEVRSVCFSPDSKRIVSGSGDRTVKVWDAETGQEKLTFKGHTNSVLSVCFSPNDKQIVSGSHDGTAKVWDAETGQETLTLKGHTSSVYSVCFSPDGKRLASRLCTDRTVKVWNAETGQEKLHLQGARGRGVQRVLQAGRQTDRRREH